MSKAGSKTERIPDQILTGYGPCRPWQTFARCLLWLFQKISCSSFIQDGVINSARQKFVKYLIIIIIDILDAAILRKLQVTNQWTWVKNPNLSCDYGTLALLIAIVTIINESLSDQESRRHFLTDRRPDRFIYFLYPRFLFSSPWASVSFIIP